MNKRKMSLVALLVAAIGLLSTPAFALQPETQPPTKVADAIWYNGSLYGTILLGDIKNPNPKSLNAIYLFMGVEGQHSISEAAPGDPAYKGGRWMVFPVTFTAQGLDVHDPDGDGTVNFELMSVEALFTHEGLGHLTIGQEPIRYFICPMIPQNPQ